MRYAHIVEVLESLGWKVEETEDKLSVIAGPVDKDNGTGFVKVDVGFDSMDDRTEKLTAAARDLADQLLSASWMYVQYSRKFDDEVVGEEKTDDGPKLYVPEEGEE